MNDKKVTFHVATDKVGSAILTEKQIRAYDERYWAFVVPVEEVGDDE
ncbi:DUF1642 domain-containing protein [Listeria grandensis]|nr:hypothetical protein [Listeria grandensis]MBC1474944.1 DUF1642 domain-containing protein [Listeria grandensis]